MVEVERESDKKNKYKKIFIKTAVEIQINEFCS